MRQFFYCFVLLFTFGFVQVSGGYAATPEDARKFIDDIGARALEVIKSSPNGSAEKRAKLEEMFAQNVDIPWIGQFVLGRFWRQLNPEQQQNYLKEYQDFLITHYTSNFTDYSGGGYKVIGAKPGNDGQFIVSMQIEPPDKQPFNVEYRVRTNNAGEMKVYDIIVEGVSLITTQRSEFGSVVQNRGIDTLIDQLKMRTAKTRAAAK